MMAIHKIVFSFVGFIWSWLSRRQLSVGQHVEKREEEEEEEGEEKEEHRQLYSIMHFTQTQ